jgi:hypothetical protein
MTLEQLDERKNQDIKRLFLAEGSVRVQLGSFADRLTIYEWESLTKDQGNTIIALKELRAKYSHIMVDDIGATSEDSSWKYWLHMRDKGLVDALFRGSGIQVL